MPDRPIGDVLRAHAPALMGLPGVVGTGRGLTDAGVPCILVLVSARSPELDARLPASLEGHPVVVRESGPIRARGDD